jgi:hypothetical protein
MAASSHSRLCLGAARLVGARGEAPTSEKEGESLPRLPAATLPCPTYVQTLSNMPRGFAASSSRRTRRTFARPHGATWRVPSKSIPDCAKRLNDASPATVPRNSDCVSRHCTRTLYRAYFLDQNARHARFGLGNSRISDGKRVGQVAAAVPYIHGDFQMPNLPRVVSSYRIDQSARVALEEDRRRLDQLIVDGASTDLVSDVAASLHRYIRPKTIRRRRSFATPDDQQFQCSRR